MELTLSRPSSRCFALMIGASSSKPCEGLTVCSTVEERERGVGCVCVGACVSVFVCLGTCVSGCMCLCWRVCVRAVVCQSGGDNEGWGLSVKSQFVKASTHTCQVSSTPDSHVYLSLI